MAGITAPVRFMADVRAMLIEQPNCDHEDPRVVPLLARCIPSDQLKELYRGDDDAESYVASPCSR